jgi:CubicO group peptidase (beta-lactamase class C family)
MTTVNRRRLLQLTAAAGVTALSRRSFAIGETPYWPDTTDWQKRSPLDAGFEPKGVDEAIKYAGDHNSTGLVILRGGRIVTEQYWQNWTAETSQPIFSASKSLTAILVGMAIEERLIKSVEQPASNWVNAWKSEGKSAITLRHMLSMTSGIQVGAPNVSRDIDAFEQTAALPLEHRPGTDWAYNTPVYRMLLRVLELASNSSIDDYTKRKLAVPIGMNQSYWNCGPAPNNRTNCTWYSSCLRDMARFGLLILRDGNWVNRQLISKSFVRESITPSQKLNESYGYLWWLNGKASYKLPAGTFRSGMLWPDCPRDAYGALGAQDKKIYIVPSLDLVVSRHGGPAGVARTPGAEGAGGDSFDNELLGRICRAVRH